MASQLFPPPRAGVRVGGDRQSGGVVRLERAGVDPARRKSVLAGATAFGVAALAPAGEQQSARQDAIAAEHQAGAAPPDLDRRLDRQLQAISRMGASPIERVAHGGFVVAPPHQVVHVAHQTARAAAFEQQPVETGQVVVGEVLRGQGADGQALAGRGVVGLDDAREQGQQAPILEAALQQGEQRCVVDAGEVGPNVDLGVQGQRR